MVEAVMLWNEPNNMSHWDFKVDPEWKMFAALIHEGVKAIRAVNPELKIVLGGISPIDPNYLKLLDGYGVIDAVDVVAVHGFPLDWNHWNIHQWPQKIEECRSAIRNKPIWVSEAGCSSFGAEEVQAWGMKKTAELLVPLVERVHWYSLMDLPSTWTATTRHKEAEGSAYYRHFYMGLYREDGTPKCAATEFQRSMGICQWFHFEDHRLDFAVERMRELKVPYLRTGISWADWFRENSEAWFDRQMSALDEFNTTITLCFTPEHLGVVPHYTSPAKNPADFGEFAAWAIGRYAPKGRTSGVSAPKSETNAELVGAKE